MCLDSAERNTQQMVSCHFDAALLCLLGQIWLSSESGQHHFCPDYNLTSRDAYVHQVRASFILWPWAGHASRFFFVSFYSSCFLDYIHFQSFHSVCSQAAALLYSVGRRASANRAGTQECTNYSYVRKK